MHLSSDPIAYKASSVVHAAAVLQLRLVGASSGARLPTTVNMHDVYFRGYLTTQVAGGVWADKYGGKAVLGFGVIWWSIATALTPLAASLGLPALLFARACMGVGEGVAMPAMNNLLSRYCTAPGFSVAMRPSAGLLCCALCQAVKRRMARQCHALPALHSVLSAPQHHDSVISSGAYCWAPCKGGHPTCWYQACQM